MSAEAARLLRERADSYARDAEALRGSDPDALVILTGMRDELRKVADQIGGWDATVEAMRGGLLGFDNTGRLHGAGCVECDNGVQEFHRSRTDRPNLLRQCCGLPRDDDGRCAHRPHHPMGAARGGLCDEPGCGERALPDGYYCAEHDETNR